MSKRSSRSSSDGLTLIELLVATAVVLVVSAAAIAFAFASRRLVDRDRTRLELVESVRAARDFLVTDLRQAGERLSGDFPAIEIVDGPGGAPDVVIVRRNLIDTVLRACSDVDTSSQKIAVATPGGGGTGPCAPLPDDDGDGWPDNLQAWRERRLGAGGRLEAYVFDPVRDVGEFFPVVGERSATISLDVDPSHAWARAYPATNDPRLYLLEERRYELNRSMLNLIVNGRRDRPLSIVDGLADLQLTAELRDGTRLSALGPADHWTALRSIDIELLAARELRGARVERSWSGTVLPRNVLSR